LQTVNVDAVLEEVEAPETDVLQKNMIVLGPVPRKPKCNIVALSEAGIM
jgi:hypothetical protein